MKKLLVVLLIALGSFLVNYSYANAIFDITPSLNSVYVVNGGSSDVTWTVTNNSQNNTSIDQLSVNPTYQSTGQANGILLLNNTCTGTLAAQDSCTFTTRIASTNQPANFVITPQICGFNGEICSVPSLANHLKVHINSAIAYIPLASLNELIPVDKNGTLGTPLTGLNLNSYYGEGIAISPDGTRIYLTATNAIDVISTGMAPTLITQIPINQNASLTGLAVSPDGKTIYAIDWNINEVWAIDFNNNTYTLESNPIAGPDGSFPGPWDIVFAPNNQTAYLGSLDIDLYAIDVASKTSTDISDDPIFQFGINMLTVSPDGNALYASLDYYKIAVMDTANQNISSITINNTPTPQIPSVAISPNSRYVYAIDISVVRPPAKLWIIDTQNSDNVLGPYLQDAGITADTVAISPDGSTLFLTSSASNSIYIAPLVDGLPSGSVTAVDMGGTQKMIGNKFVY